MHTLAAYLKNASRSDGVSASPAKAQATESANAKNTTMFAVFFIGVQYIIELN